MASFIKKYRLIIGTLVVISIAFLILAIKFLTPQKDLKVYSPIDVNPKLVDSTVQDVGTKHRIAPFSFINQNGKVITEKDYEGKIYVADFFFTKCQTICPIMTDNMTWLQGQIKDMPDVMLLSHSVTPDIDSVPVLRRYATEKGAIDGKWNLVTGNKRDIFGIARKSYLAVETNDAADLYDMVHTENFILVDKKGRIRGFYNGTNRDSLAEGEKNVTQLLEDIKWLREQ
ncbi:cytochrome C oxidase assembly protein [Flavobacterium akiainvivens]|uniref:Cytochrome C oxidase assembly protein n=1 Tax=Flavobacterium akiainvivens TaxID=1202724 RepID=A0A0M9VJ04_9FLAO|nr:SCO family protein [Flavobacterium akiainvivens]KOS07192.1 cytochrome C oxidase assembly protein [Flavobacterium akiainvivens]SFQ72787.1 protein SCO1/2 [Flavobacterium akiainvivens]